MASPVPSVPRGATSPGAGSVACCLFCAYLPDGAGSNFSLTAVLLRVPFSGAACAGTRVSSRKALRSSLMISKDHQLVAKRSRENADEGRRALDCSLHRLSISSLAFQRDATMRCSSIPNLKRPSLLSRSSPCRSYQRCRRRRCCRCCPSTIHQLMSGFGRGPCWCSYPSIDWRPRRLSLSRCLNPSRYLFPVHLRSQRMPALQHRKPGSQRFSSWMFPRCCTGMCTGKLQVRTRLRRSDCGERNAVAHCEVGGMNQVFSRKQKVRSVSGTPWLRGGNRIEPKRSGKTTMPVYHRFIDQSL